MSTQIYPLLKGICKRRREVAAPVVLWENSRGAFVGSRWLFVNVPTQRWFWQRGGAQAWSQWARFCAKGVTELWIKPNYASYEPGEHAMLTIQTQLIGRNGTKQRLLKRGHLIFVSSVKMGCKDAWTHHVTAAVNKEFNIVRIPVPLRYKRGLYRVTCMAKLRGWRKAYTSSGLLGTRRSLLAEGSPITCGSRLFHQGWSSAACSWHDVYDLRCGSEIFIPAECGCLGSGYGSDGQSRH